MRGRWSGFVVVLAQAFCALPAIAVAQEIILLEQNRAPETIAANLLDSLQTPADTTALPRISISSALERIRSRLDAGYHAAPVHPYFRDEQRVINDMRRLVFLADKRVVRGVESIPELIEIAQKMSVPRQTTIIRMAAAGSVANVTAENIMKHVRQRQINFVRVEVERVQLQTNWRGNHLSLARGLERQTYTVSRPKLRAAYSRTDHARFVSHHFNITPLPRVSLNYIRWNELDIFSAIYMLHGGFTLASYDYTRKSTLLGFRLQEKRNWVGIFLIKNHRVPAGDWWRFDVWLVL
jgi:hypothetical protein